MNSICGRHWEAPRGRSLNQAVILPFWLSPQKLRHITLEPAARWLLGQLALGSVLSTPSLPSKFSLPQPCFLRHRVSVGVTKSQEPRVKILTGGTHRPCGHSVTLLGNPKPSGPEGRRAPQNSNIPLHFSRKDNRLEALRPSAEQVMTKPEYYHETGIMTKPMYMYTHLIYNVPSPVYSTLGKTNPSGARASMSGKQLWSRSSLTYIGVPPHPSRRNPRTTEVPTRPERS